MPPSSMHKMKAAGRSTGRQLVIIVRGVSV
jgi:hypothetical protein